MPRILEPVTVVKTPEVDITEYAGNGSSGQPAISLAHVKAEGNWAEPWQCPEFDEWVLIQKGEVHIEHSHGDTVVVKAGQAVCLAKGERVQWVFPDEISTSRSAPDAPANVLRRTTDRTLRPTTSTWTSTTWCRRTTGRPPRRATRRCTIPPRTPWMGSRTPPRTQSIFSRWATTSTRAKAGRQTVQWKLLKMTRHTLGSEKDRPQVQGALTRR